MQDQDVEESHEHLRELKWKKRLDEKKKNFIIYDQSNKLELVHYYLLFEFPI
jgi:hypothetical protein